MNKKKSKIKLNYNEETSKLLHKRGLRLFEVDGFIKRKKKMNINRSE